MHELGLHDTCETVLGFSRLVQADTEASDLITCSERLPPQHSQPCKVWLHQHSEPNQHKEMPLLTLEIEIAKHATFLLHSMHHSAIFIPF